MVKTMLGTGAMMACCCFAWSSVAYADNPVGVAPDTTDLTPADAGDVDLEMRIADLRARLVPLDPNKPVQKQYVLHGSDTVVPGGSVAGPIGDRIAYSNKLGEFIFRPGVGVRINDDLFTLTIGGCEPSRLVIKVDGGGDGSNTECVGDPGIGQCFAFTYAFMTDCQSASGLVVPGSQRTVFLPNDGTHEVTIDFAGRDVVLPLTTIWLRMVFNSNNAGWVAGSSPTVGFSSNIFDAAGFNCAANFGDPDLFGSFDAELFVKSDCPPGFLAYRASNPVGNAFNPDGNTLFADDTELVVPACDLVGYEIGVRGIGTYRFSLRSFLSGEEAGVIPGTSKTFVVQSSVNARVARFLLDEPVPIPEKLWVSFRASNPTSGIILANTEAVVGRSEDLYSIFNPGTGNWFLVNFAGNPLANFDISLICAGEPPPGACCSLNWRCALDRTRCTTDDDCPGEGDSCQFDDRCMPMAELNCNGFTGRWRGNGICEPDPFFPVCGTAACCESDENCNNEFPEDCIDGGGFPESNEICSGFNCGFFACRIADNVCSSPFPRACTESGGACTSSTDCPIKGEVCGNNAGCSDVSCCNQVCNRDAFCCNLDFGEWDAFCADTALDLCTPPAEDGCIGARVISTSTSIAARTINNRRATTGTGDLPFCCHTTESSPSAQLGKGSIWFKFVATAESAKLSTCQSNAPADDSLLQVFESDGKTPVDQCGTLTRLACNDDNFGDSSCTQSGERNAGLCVSNLIVDRTYYVEVASKTEFDRGEYRLDLTMPCTGSIPDNDSCLNSVQLDVPDVGETLEVSFNLNNATFDCPGELCIRELKTDLWYKIEPTRCGTLTVDTCGFGSPQDTTLAIYDGCECPAASIRLKGCNDNFCGDGSSISIDTFPGNCFLIRLGGSNNDFFPQGVMRVTLDDDCRDCQPNGIPDELELAGNPSADQCGAIFDNEVICAPNAVPDECDIRDGLCTDANENGTPDECEPGCDTVDDCVPSGDACVEDQCFEGLCFYPPKDCDDGLACTTDSCFFGQCINTDVFCSTGLECCEATGTCEESCGGGDCIRAIIGSTPDNCVIDARQTSDLDGSNPAGWDSVDIEFDGLADCIVVADFSISSTGGAPPSISGLSAAGNVLTVSLSGRIEPGAWTCIAHLPSGGEVCLGYLPADANNDETAAAPDIIALVDHLNGVLPAMVMYQCDADRSDQCNGADIVRLIDLLNGAGPVFDTWVNVGIGGCPSAP